MTVVSKTNTENICDFCGLRLSVDTIPKNWRKYRVEENTNLYPIWLDVCNDCYVKEGGIPSQSLFKSLIKKYIRRNK